jgi:SAM-dependent methyltransferase
MDRATFESQLQIIAEQATRTHERFSFSQSEIFPCLDDDTVQTSFDHHYVYHTGWAARRLAKVSPRLHVDFGSSIYFAAIASTICPFKFYDYRPARLSLQGVEPAQADLSSLPFPNDSIESVSCMHVVEHVGLGRYGDPIDYDGDLKAIGELSRIVAPGGSLLFVVPVGQPRLLFNAHRIYAYDQILHHFGGIFAVDEFALITDAGRFIRGAGREEANAQSYGCGCFHFKKLPRPQTRREPRRSINQTAPFPEVLVINLDHRTDRWAAIQKKCEDANLNPLRVPAVQMSPSWQACGYSHLKCVRIAKDRGLPWLVILEDDATFSSGSIERFRDLLPYLWENRDKWERFTGGPTFPANPVIRILDREQKLLYARGFCTHFNLIHSGAYDQILKWDPSQKMIDVYYMNLESSFRVVFNSIATVPHISAQSNSASDVARSVGFTDSDYSEMFVYSEQKLRECLEALT